MRHFIGVKNHCKRYSSLASVNSLRPTKLWWLVGLVLLCLSLLIQLPAAWLLQKFSPNNPYLQQVSGNLWQGQANWQINALTTWNAPKRNINSIDEASLSLVIYKQIIAKDINNRTLESKNFRGFFLGLIANFYKRIILIFFKRKIIKNNTLN